LFSEYIDDPFSDDPYEEQSLAEMLASRDFSSCEMEKVWKGYHLIDVVKQTRKKKENFFATLN